MSQPKITPKDIVNNALNEPWKVDIEPFRVAPHIYYVGNVWVTCYLIDTGEGLVLIDTSVFPTLYLLLENIRKLGYDPKDIKKILLSHAHADHDGSAVHLKEMTGAELWLSKEDWAFKNDTSIPESVKFSALPYEVDHFYSDEEPIVMGDITIHARLCAGHTPGTTSFFAEDKDENGNTLVWAMHGGVGVNTMNDDYFAKSGLPKSLRKDFVKSCEELKKIHVDICTPSHPAHIDILSKIPEDRMDYTPFIDPAVWPAFLEERAENVRNLIKD